MASGSAPEASPGFVPEAVSGLAVAVEELPRWRRRLSLVIPPDRMRLERQRLTREYGRRLKVPGFRPGHAPVELVRKRFGSEIERDAIRSLLGWALREAIRERDLHPMSSPVVSAVDLDQQDTLRATAELDVRPVISLARTGGFRLERADPEVPENAVDRVLEKIRDDRAAPTPVDRPAARGDLLIVDVKPIDAEGREVEAYPIVLGSGSAGLEIEAQLEGARAGDEREVATRDGAAPDAAEEDLPGDIPTAPPAGSGAEDRGTSGVRRYRVLVREVKERILPELDDAFAAAVSPAATLKELRDRLGENLRREAAERAERDLRERLMDAIAEANAVEVPESMVEAYVRRMLRPPAAGADDAHIHTVGAGAALSRGGGDPQRPGSEEAWTEQDEKLAEVLRPAAERSLRRRLILEAVGTNEELEPSEEQLETYLRGRLEPGLNLEEARRTLERQGRLDDLRLHLRDENVFEHLERQSTILAAGERRPAEPTR